MFSCKRGRYAAYHVSRLGGGAGKDEDDLRAAGGVAILQFVTNGPSWRVTGLAAARPANARIVESFMVNGAMRRCDRILDSV